MNTSLGSFVRKRGKFFFVMALLLNAPSILAVLFGSGATPAVNVASHYRLRFSTHLGGSGWDFGEGIAVAGDGSCYVTGGTRSSDFPTKNAYNSIHDGWFDDVFITKFAANGSLLWSTFLGGSNSDEGWGIAVASDGSCYVTGTTWSDDFPTKNAYNSTYGGDGGGPLAGDAFVAKFSSTGSLLWSTYLGGNNPDIGYSVAIGSDGSCYVTGYTESSNFPTLNAYDSTYDNHCDAFVTKFSPNGALLWSTFLGGRSQDIAYHIALSSDDSCYVTGFTCSSNFPTQNAYQSTYVGDVDAFVSKFSADGSLLWSTYLGGRGNEKGVGIAVAGDGSCSVTGATLSSNFPIKNAFDRKITYGEFDAFITTFAANGSLLWSTYLGGRDEDIGFGIAIDSDGSRYVTGYTLSKDFPKKNAYDRRMRFVKAFVTKVDSGGSLLWSTYLGGSDAEHGRSIAATADGSCYVTGYTWSDDFPTKQAYDRTLNGQIDVFVTKFAPARYNNSVYYSFLAVLIVIPITAFVWYKRKKELLFFAQKKT